MKKDTVKINGKDVPLRKWPLRPGWKIAGQLTRIGAEVLGVLGEGELVNLMSLDFAKIAGVISDENCELVVMILNEGLWDGDDIAGVEALSLEEGITALEAVLRHNLSFLQSRLAILKPLSETSTPLARS